MSDEITRFQCRHIFTDGHRCGSACLRHEEFCYYHHTTRRPVENPRRRRSRQSQFDLPLPEDRTAIQSSIGEVLRRIASNEIDSKRAGLPLYGLQIASRDRALRDEEDTPETTLIEEIVHDPKLGALAPRAEIAPEEEKLSTVGRLLRDLKLDSERKEHKRAEAAEAGPKAESDTLAAPIPSPEHPVKSPQRPHQADEIVPIIQACEDQAAEDAHVAKVALPQRPLDQNLCVALCLSRRRQPQSRRNQRCQYESNRSNTQRIAQPCMFRDAANQKWCGSADHAANVVHKAHGGGAQRSRKQFAGNNAEAAEIARPEKTHERSFDQQRVRITHKRKQRHQQSSNQKIADVRVLPAKAVGKVSK